jgi:pyrroline-5-carboxylate reductase
MSQDPRALQRIATTRITVIGAGNLGGPVIRAFLAAGVDPDRVQVVNSSRESSRQAAESLGVQAGEDRASAVTGADVVVLGVKPYQVLEVSREIAPNLEADAVVVSLAAGTRLARIQDELPDEAAVVRAMPNTPIGVGEGVVALMPGDAVTTPQIELVRALFCRAGLVREITEDQVHAVIGAAGSASAFVFYAIEAMIDEAVRQGLKRPLATQLVEQTVRGAATMLIESGEHPAIARGGVTSPGGTTAQGIAALDKAGVRAGLAAAMDAATASSRELSGE